jgi:cell filamentation protein
MAADPYLYPGTNTLKNLAGIQDSSELERFEAISTANRITQLHFQPLSGHFDVVHLQGIHRHIFQDVYSWAGEFRTVDMATQGGSWFCRPEFILQSLTNLFLELEREENLKSAAQEKFFSKAAHYMGEINAVHPFREGNGRAQREFIREMGLHAGFHVNWAKVTRAAMYSASVVSFEKGDSGPLVRLIAEITTPFAIDKKTDN